VILWGRKWGQNAQKRTEPPDPRIEPEGLGIAQTPCRLEQAESLGACLKLLDALEELDDVRSVTANLEADDALMQAVLN
jgi:hypothetical protein